MTLISNSGTLILELAQLCSTIRWLTGGESHALAR